MNSMMDLAAFSQFNQSHETPLQARRKAGMMFSKALGRGLTRSLLCRLFSKGQNCLRDLGQDGQGVQRWSGSETAVESIPLVNIVGSEGRSNDFDGQFYPLQRHNRERWIGIAAARRQGAILPPVQLIQFGDDYYVRDGHHRISVAKALGQVEIEALIVYRLRSRAVL